jgi:hypothetical protein
MEEQPLSLRGLRESQWQQMKWYLSFALKEASFTLRESISGEKSYICLGKRLDMQNRSKREQKRPRKVKDKLLQNPVKGGRSMSALKMAVCIGQNGLENPITINLCGRLPVFFQGGEERFS